MRIIAFRHDSVGPALPKMRTNLGRAETAVTEHTLGRVAEEQAKFTTGHTDAAPSSAEEQAEYPAGEGDDLAAGAGVDGG